MRKYLTSFALGIITKIFFSMEDLKNLLEQVEEQAIQCLRDCDDKIPIENVLLATQQSRIEINKILKLKKRQRTPSPPPPPPRPIKRTKENGIFIRKGRGCNKNFHSEWLEDIFGKYGKIDETFIPKRDSYWAIVRFETSEQRQQCLNHSKEIYDDYHLEFDLEKERRDKN